MIRTSFGSIRAWEASDRAALVRYANNRKIATNLRDGFPHPYTEASADAFLGMARTQRPVTTFAITTEQEAIGGIGVFPGQDVHRLTAEMGYWLAEPFWGRGWMTEAVRVFASYAFETFGLERIYAEPFAENAASARVLEKAGFLLEGRMRRNVIKEGRVLDQLLYARVRGEGQEG